MELIKTNMVALRIGLVELERNVIEFHKLGKK